jgi:hypothetical protein
VPQGPRFDRVGDYQAWPYVVRWGSGTDVRCVIRFSTRALAQSFADQHPTAVVTYEEKKK